MACSLCSMGSLAVAGPVDDFDDVAFWTGAGANRAAMAIDFIGESGIDLSLVWGFRWDGVARGRDMLNAVLAADVRLYAKIGNEFPVTNALLGFGYDRNDDGEFGVTPPADFNAEGVAFGLPESNAGPTDSADWYREGWEKEDGFWHYGYAETNPWSAGDWTSSPSSASGRVLQNNEWNSWAFSESTEPGNFLHLFARNAFAAAPPEGLADFDANHHIDGGDLLVWQRGFGFAGTATPLEGDANGDGDVDAGDYAAWRAAFGAATAVSTAHVTSHIVPEPNAAALALGFVLSPCLLTMRRKNA